MNKIQTLAAKVLGLTPIIERNPAPSPRSEAANLSSSATAATIQSAKRAAEKGDTKELFRLYHDSVLGDDHIQGCLNTRKLAVLGQPMSIIPRTKGNQDDLDAAAACRRAVSDAEGWAASLAALLDSAFWPVTVCEKIFRAADEPAEDEPRLQYTLRKLDQVPPHQFCFKWAYQSGVKIDMTVFEPLLKLWPIDAEGLIQYDLATATPLDPVRHLVHRGHLLTGFRDNKGGPGAAILAWWLLRALGRDWFARFMERYGSPFPKGKTNANDPQAVAFLQDAFSLATKVGGIVIGQDDEVELVQAMVQGGSEGHKLWSDVCNNAISRAITGYDSNTAPAGLNSGESHKSENVRDDVRMFDQMMLAETLEKQLFAPFLKFNGLPGSVKVSFGGLNDADAKSFAETVKIMKEAGYELTDESMDTANERTGLVWQRAAAPANNFPGGPDAASLATFAAQLGGARVLASRLPAVTHPSDGVASENARIVGDAMRAAFKPAVQIIQDARTPAECETRLAAFFADWRPKQFVTALEKPLQICAAKGAVEAKPAT